MEIGWDRLEIGWDRLGIWRDRLESWRYRVGIGWDRRAEAGSFGNSFRARA